MRMCAIDIGSNSVRSLVADVKEDGSIVPVERGLEITRLSGGMEQSGAISPAAAGRTVAALEKFLAHARGVGAERLILFGTHALRTAENSRSFIEHVRERTGCMIRVLTGIEEAEWIHRGVTHALAGEPANALIIDIGGGSTELITGVKEGSPLFTSIRLGCVSMTERFLRTDPPLREETAALRRFTARLLFEEAPEIAGSGKRLIGAGGTITAAAALALELERYDPARVHGVRLPFTTVASLFEKVAATPLEERKGIPGMEEKRADIIPGGMLILLGIMEFCGARDITVSDQGILYGSILSATP